MASEGWRTARVWGEQRLRRRLVAFARRFVGDVGEAEDVVQETLLRAGAGLPRLRSEECAEAWLFRVCRHAAIDHVRARRVRRGVWASLPEDAEARAPEALGEPGDPPDALAAQGALRRLPAHHRLLLHLHYDRGWSQPDLCRRTGLSPSALRVRLFRARQGLLGVRQGRAAG